MKNKTAAPTFSPANFGKRKSPGAPFPLHKNAAFPTPVPERVLNISAYSAKLCWSAPFYGNPTGYEFWITSGTSIPLPSQEPDYKCISSAQHIMVHDLLPNTTCKWWVRALYSKDKRSDWAAGPDFTTSNTIHHIETPAAGMLPQNQLLSFSYRLHYFDPEIQMTDAPKLRVEITADEGLTYRILEEFTSPVGQHTHTKEIALAAYAGTFVRLRISYALSPGLYSISFGEFNLTDAPLPKILDFTSQATEVCFQGIIQNVLPRPNFENRSHLVWNVVSGNAYPIIVSAPDIISFGVKTLWVDFNRELDFEEEGEVLLTTEPSHSPWTGAIMIPLDETGGRTQMRIKLSVPPSDDSQWTELNGKTLRISLPESILRK